MPNCLTSPVTLWIIIGVLLVGAEFLVPGLWIIFFGASAIITGLLNAIFCLGLPLSIIVCAVLGCILLVLSRKLFPDFFSSRNNTDTSDKHIETDDIEGAIATVTEAITAEKPGKVEFRGSAWIAASDHDIAVGTTVTIVSRKNLTLKVK